MPMQVPRRGEALQVDGVAVKEGRSPCGPFLSQQDPLALQ